jgi:hypothetical protein
VTSSTLNPFCIFEQPSVRQCTQYFSKGLQLPTAGESTAAVAAASAAAADRIIQGLIDHGMSSFQSGMDSVRNLTGSPIAGLDPHELLDTR